MIGQPYTPNPSSFTDLEFKIVEVIYCKGLDAYTIIRASAPEGWKDGEQVSSHLPAVLFLTVFLHDSRMISETSVWRDIKPLLEQLSFTSWW